MRRGCTSRLARPRKCRVSRIASSPSLSRSSLASSSSPVASGTGEDLLGALRAVALPPARLWVLLDQLAQLEDAVHQSLGPWRAAGHVHVDRHELVGGD